MELPESIARNALHLLRYLSERERRREPKLPEIPEISEAIRLTPADTSDLIDILDSEAAIKAFRTIDGGASPMITGHGKLMQRQLEERFSDARKESASEGALQEVDRPANLFLKQGDYWTLKFGSNQPVRLKDSVGLVYIHYLIQHPGQELLPMRVVQQTRGDAAVGRTATAAETKDADLSLDDFSGTGPSLDDQALQEYRKHIEDLEEDIEEAERDNNPEAATNAREEKQLVESERPVGSPQEKARRPVGSPQEKARKSVSEAIHRALKNIRTLDSHLGNHLTNSINTGVRVSYSPEPAVAWHL
ncbi:MAG: hypothetical protein QGI09_00250 [Dehalococcoidia bacterium]|nr:hypothetical protein [Dehalococcoidia bacterium]